jgi:c-di-GMP-binding flagellar brake protein YcgR
MNRYTTSANPEAGSAADTDDLQVEERRAHERYSARSFLRVFDRESGQALGDIDDISLGGFRLETGYSQDLGDPGPRALRIEICIEGRKQAPIAVDACQRWINREAEHGVTRAGYEFVALTPLARQRIERFIAELSG